MKYFFSLLLTTSCYAAGGLSGVPLSAVPASTNVNINQYGQWTNTTEALIVVDTNNIFSDSQGNPAVFVYDSVMNQWNRSADGTADNFFIVFNGTYYQVTCDYCGPINYASGTLTGTYTNVSGAPGTVVNVYQGTKLNSQLVNASKVIVAGTNAANINQPEVNVTPLGVTIKNNRDDQSSWWDLYSDSGENLFLTNRGTVRGIKLLNGPPYLQVGDGNTGFNTVSTNGTSSTNFGIFTGTTNIGGAATSLRISLGLTVANTNYVPITSFTGSGLAAGVGVTYSNITTTSFDMLLSGAIVGGKDIKWSVIVQ